MRMFNKFSRGEHGSLSIEAVLVMPILVWAITATFVFWDAFKTINISQKATYTIADMLSREENGVGPDFLTAAHETFNFLAGQNGDNALRVTVVLMVQDPDTLDKTIELVWSEGVGGISGYTDLDIILDRLPDMADGDQMIVVESEQDWSPAFAVGLTNYRFREVALSRPRRGQLVWDPTGT